MPAHLTPEQIADRMLAEAGLEPFADAPSEPDHRLFGDIDWTGSQHQIPAPVEPKPLDSDAITREELAEPRPGQWGPIEPLPIERRPRLLDRMRDRWRLPSANPGLVLALPLAVALSIFIARMPAPSVSVSPPAITVVSPPSHAPSRADGERRPAAATRTATRQSRGTDRGAESAPAAPSKSSGGRVPRLSPARGPVPPPDADATVEFLP